MRSIWDVLFQGLGLGDNGPMGPRNPDYMNYDPGQWAQDPGAVLGYLPYAGGLGPLGQLGQRPDPQARSLSFQPQMPLDTSQVEIRRPMGWASRVLDEIASQGQSPFASGMSPYGALPGFVNLPGFPDTWGQPVNQMPRAPWQ